VSLRRGLERLEGVESAKLIVKPAHMQVRIKPGYWPDPASMLKTVKEAGFTPVPEQVEVLLTGRVVRRDGKLAIELDRMRKPLTLLVAPDPQSADGPPHLERHVDQTVELEGLWHADESDEAGSVVVTAVREAKSTK
jgi:hypothetical protein